MLTDDEFRALFDEFYPAVLGYGLRRVDPETARDVAAETFLVAWRQLEDPPAAPKAWLLAVARKVLANELRRRARADRLAAKVGKQEALCSASRSVAADPGLSVGDADDVHRALANLSAADQELLRLVGWDLLDQAELAQVLGCSRAALKVRLHRARRRLDASLATQRQAPTASRGSSARVAPVPPREAPLAADDLKGSR